MGSQTNQITNVAVPAGSIINHAANVLPCGIGQLSCAVQIGLNLINHFLFHFLAMPVDQFNAIVMKRIVTGRNHNSTVKIFRPHYIGNAWCGGYMKQIRIRTGSSQSCNQRILKHVAASSCIFSDHNLCFVFSSVIPSKESSYFISMFHSQIHIRFSTKTIGTKIFSHDVSSDPFIYIFCLLVHFCQLGCLVCCDQTVNDLIKITI